jgi:hypothetical protein
MLIVAAVHTGIIVTAKYEAIVRGRRGIVGVRVTFGPSAVGRKVKYAAVLAAPLVTNIMIILIKSAMMVILQMAARQPATCGC